jgi:hypothetical protein
MNKAICDSNNDNSWSQGYKTENGNLSQISRIWLAEMATHLHFSQSDAWDLRLVSNLSFIIFSAVWLLVVTPLSKVLKLVSMPPARKWICLCFLHVTSRFWGSGSILPGVLVNAHYTLLKGTGFYTCRNWWKYMKAGCICKHYLY